MGEEEKGAGAMPVCGKRSLFIIISLIASLMDEEFGRGPQQSQYLYLQSSMIQVNTNYLGSHIMALMLRISYDMILLRYDNIMIIILWGNLTGTRKGKGLGFEALSPGIEKRS